MSKPIAIFDIDGTIFRSSLTIQLFERLVATKIFSSGILAQVRRSEQKWLNRRGHYENYIRDVVIAYQKAIIGKSKSQILQASRAVVKEQKHRTYQYTRSLLHSLRERYFMIGISGSPLEVVREYNKFLKFDKLYGWEFGLDERSRYTGKVLHTPSLYKKELILRFLGSHGLTLNQSIGIGDTESDIGFLDLVETPIAFNPNRSLAAAAKKKNWTVVIERKDLTVEFKPSKVKFLKYDV